MPFGFVSWCCYKKIVTQSSRQSTDLSVGWLVGGSVGKSVGWVEPNHLIIIVPVRTAPPADPLLVLL